jgi:hypothetical protein
VIAADEPEIARAADKLRAFNVTVTPVEADLAPLEGVDIIGRGERPRG